MHLHVYGLCVGCSTYKCRYVETETLSLVFSTRAPITRYTREISTLNIVTMHVHVRAQVRCSKISEIYASAL